MRSTGTVSDFADHPLSLGILLAADSGGKQGGDHLTRAIEMLQQMDMKFWLKSATDYRSDIR